MNSIQQVDAAWLRLVGARVQAFREAGLVVRCHASGGPTYDVAQHSFGAVSLLLVLYPGEPPISLVKAVLWHDADERWLGDLPYPALRASQPLRIAYESLQRRVLGSLQVPVLAPEDMHWLSAVDKLELYLWALTHRPAHPAFARSYLNNLDAWFDAAQGLPPQAKRFYQHLACYGHDQLRLSEDPEELITKMERLQHEYQEAVISAADEVSSITTG